MVWSYMRDYPHGYLIGVVFHLWKRWINWKSSIRIMKQQQHEINEHLMQMIPPHEIHRLVRPSTTEKCKCKALEWRNWLQFYDIPCLTRILHDYALQHFALIVKSIFTLLRTNITEEKLRKTKHDLLLFVYTYEILYGERFVTFNVHIVKYLVKCVKQCGPLWSGSTFPFESAIYFLKWCVHGLKGMYEQMSKDTLKENVLQSLKSELVESRTVLEYCNSLYSRQEVSSFCRTDGVVLIGKDSLEPTLPLYEDKADFTFNRCIFLNMAIHTKNYDLEHKSNNNVFHLENEQFVQVLNLTHYDKEAYAGITNFKIVDVILPEKVEDRDNNLPLIDDIKVLYIICMKQNIVHILNLYKLKT